MKKHQKKLLNSKVYDAHDLSLAINNDEDHNQFEKEKKESVKNIQQQKQIDRMFKSLVKERLFGHMLAQNTRMSIDGYYELNKISKSHVKPIRLPHRRIFPSSKYDRLAQVQIMPSKFNTIDLHKRSQELSSLKKGSEQARSSRYSRRRTVDQFSKTNRSFKNPKEINISKLSNFSTYFRNLTKNTTSMLYDIKITKDMIVRHNENIKSMSQQYLQKFLFFFNFGTSMSYRQYCNWIEATGNCTSKQSSFYFFQCLDENRSGYLTISDVFRSLQVLPNHEAIEKEIYKITEMIKKSYQETPTSDSQAKKCPQNFLVKNQSLKIEELRDLVKQENHDLVPASCVKSTFYHKSLYALEHDPAVREKNNQLEVSELLGYQSAGKNKLSEKAGLKFSQFAAHYENKKSIIFSIIMSLLTGESKEVFS